MRVRGAKASPKATGLSYGGGEVLVAPTVYLVLWGYSESDPVAKDLETLYSNVGGSDWLSTETQYCQSPATYITNPTGMLAGVWSDMGDPIPSKPTQAQITNEATIAAGHFGISDNQDDTVIVASASGHSESGFGTQFCGWHYNASWDGGSLSFEYLPYIPDVGSGCGANSVNQGSAGKLDGVTIVGGHELAESATDPAPDSGWTDTSNGQEIGDLCAWKNLQNIDLNGTVLPMQPLWSNDSGACVQ